MQADEKHVPPYKLFPLGDTAIVVQFGDSIKEDTHRKITALATHLEAHPFAGMTECVPAYTTLTVYYNPWIVSEGGKYSSYGKVITILEQMLPVVKENEMPVARIIEIPVCYGGEFGSDLAYVASYTHLPEQEVIAIHTSREYVVYMIGFTPGFPYLGGMDKRIATPRKQSPRCSVAAGTVGIGGTQTGIYSLETPGGWQIIGRTPLILFDVQREQPSLLQAGDKVRFVAITSEKYKSISYRQHESSHP